MANLNSKARGTGKTKQTVGKTVNAAGGHAFELNDLQKLVSGVLTSFFNEKKYYGDNSDDLVQVARRVLATNPEFVAKLAAFTRKEFHLRTISQVLLAELAYHAKGTEYTRKATHHVIERADDMIGVLAYYIDNFTTGNGRRNNKKITRGLRRGLADVFGKFKEYNLAKYKNADKGLKLKDVLNIVRPTPQDEAQAAMWKRLQEGTLKIPKTRATIISEKGNTAETWNELASGEYGLNYMDALRNLKNMIETGAEALNQAMAVIRDPKRVRTSKQLPFRFLSAYKEVEKVANAKTTGVLDALEDAMDESVANLPRFEGVTFLTGDNSGSMSSHLSEYSTVSYNDVGSLLMSVAHKFCDNPITSVFGESFQVVNASTRSGVLANMQKFRKTNVGHCTNLHKAIKYLIDNKIHVDRIVIFSDMQAYTYMGWGGSSNECQKLLAKYKKEVNPKVWLHSLDLAGYGTAKFAGDRVNLISGWSEKTLHFIKMAESLEGDLIDKINNFNLD